jgi:hypothetical protein
MMEKRYHRSSIMQYWASVDGNIGISSICLSAIQSQLELTCELCDCDSVDVYMKTGLGANNPLELLIHTGEDSSISFANFLVSMSDGNVQSDGIIALRLTSLGHAVDINSLPSQEEGQIEDTTIGILLACRTSIEKLRPSFSNNDIINFGRIGCVVSTLLMQERLSEDLSIKVNRAIDVVNEKENALSRLRIEAAGGLITLRTMLKMLKRRLDDEDRDEIDLEILDNCGLQAAHLLELLAGREDIGESGGQESVIEKRGMHGVLRSSSNWMSEKNEKEIIPE